MEAPAPGGQRHQRQQGQQRQRRPRPRALPLAVSSSLLALLLAAALGPRPGQAYPHYLLNPEGCKTKKLEVRACFFGLVSVCGGAGLIDRSHD